MTKKPHQSSDGPQKSEPEESPETTSRITQLTDTLASDKSQRMMADAQKLLHDHEKKSSKAPEKMESAPGAPLPDEPEPEPGPAKDSTLVSEVVVEVPAPDASADEEEVDKAAKTLVSAVDQMVPSLLLSLGMLDAVMKWLKSVALLLAVAIILLVVIMVNGLRASGHNQAAATQVDAANGELRLIKAELVAVQEGMKNQRKAEAKRAIAEAAQPKIVTGEDGEVAILDPKVSAEEVKVAQKKAVEAVDRGEEPPAPPPPAAKAAKIPIDIETKRKKKKGPPRPPVPPVQGPPPPPVVPPVD